MYLSRTCLFHQSGLSPHFDINTRLFGVSITRCERFRFIIELRFSVQCYALVSNLEPLFRALRPTVSTLGSVESARFPYMFVLTCEFDHTHNAVERPHDSLRITHMVFAQTGPLIRGRRIYIGA
jgi:hypothetical protein